jgi:hypothetical protein
MNPEGLFLWLIDIGVWVSFALSLFIARRWAK